MYKVDWVWQGKKIEEHTPIEEEAKELVRELKSNGVKNVKIWKEVDF